VSFVEADGPDFESFRIAVALGLSGVTFVVMEKELFSWLEGPRIKSIRGSALNLSPLARLLRPRSTGAPSFFPGFHHKKRDAYQPKTLLAKTMRRLYNWGQGEKIWAEKVASRTVNLTGNLTLTL
jgi:hypothetical protein